MFFGEAAQALQTRIAGKVLTPVGRDAERVDAYHAARAGVYAACDPRPIAIIRCHRSEDIVQALDFARDQGLPISVRSGGSTAQSVSDQSLVIDLSQMRGIALDTAQQRASLGPGITWREVEKQSYIAHGFQHDGAEHGLTAPASTYCGSGNAGFALGGGHGLLARRFGLGCDNLIGAQMVLQDGRIIEVDEDRHADLFWALRGGGRGNFGVVSRLDHRLHPVPKRLLAGFAEWSLDEAAPVLRHFRNVFLDPATPDALSLNAELTRSPAPDGPQVLRLTGLYCGAATEGVPHIVRLLAIGRPRHSRFAPISYHEFMREQGAAAVYGLHGKTRSGFFTPQGQGPVPAHHRDTPAPIPVTTDPESAGLSDAAIDTMLEQFRSAPSPHSTLRCDLFGGGAIARVPPDQTAYPHRHTPFHLSIRARWEDRWDETVNLRWLAEADAALRPYLSAWQDPNHADPEREDWPTAYYGENYPRLQQIKAEYDPGDLFRHSQSIRLPA